MSERAKFNFISAKGIAESGQKDDLAELRARLGQPGSKVLLHLHGGLVDRKAGLAVAEALSGSGAASFGLKADWTQIYVIWQTGALEEISRRWTELAEDDQLYQALVRKLLRFIAQRTMLPLLDGRSALEAIPVNDEELLARIKGERDRQDPFADLEAPFRDFDPLARSSLAPERSASALLVEFNRNLMADPLFKAAVADLDAAVNSDVEGRVHGRSGSEDRGRAILNRLGAGPRADLERPAVTDASDETERAAARGAIGVSGFVLTRAMKVALRCITRFRAQRDHGLHATIVEEVCREFYGDRIGAKIWGWMVDDAALHFGDGKLGSELLAILAEHSPERIVVTAHSAGSIWASRMLLAMAEAKSTTTVDLCLLAPAVRTGLFAETIAAAGDLVRRCQMFTMDDGLERADAVLGHDKGYVYPSSLLYLVSGLFETLDGDAYEDAPILGMQRFTGVDWLEQDEARDAAAVSAFFSQSDKAIHYSKGSGLTDAVTHGGFDDNALTLGSIRERFLA